MVRFLCFNHKSIFKHPTIHQQHTTDSPKTVGILLNLFSARVWETKQVPVISGTRYLKMEYGVRPNLQAMTFYDVPTEDIYSAGVLSSCTFYINIYIYIYICVCVCVWCVCGVCVCVCVYLCICVCLFMYEWSLSAPYAYMYECIDVYIYIYIYIYI